MRNLSPSEMLGQIYQIQKISGERVSNVVIMGTGEPMDNYDNFLKFIHLLTDENGLNISQRNVTVSTCGIVPKMKELAKEHLQITLHFHFTVPIRKSEENRCRLQINMISQKYSRPVTNISKKPAGE